MLLTMQNHSLVITIIFLLPLLFYIASKLRMKAQLDADQLLEDYLATQERLSNEHSERMIGYYSFLEEPVLIANLTRICSMVRKKDCTAGRPGTMNIALYGPISVEVLVELEEKYNTTLKPPIVHSISKVMLQTLEADSQDLPLKSVESCLEALNGTYINLLAEPVLL